MICFDLDFFPRDDADLEKYQSQFESFLYDLSHNGNIVGRWQMHITRENVQTQVMSWLPDSLQTENLSIYAICELEKLAINSGQPPQFSWRPVWSETRLCDCQTFGNLLLYTRWPEPDSPIECLSCGGEVPLYRLPHLKNAEDHQGVLVWKRKYEALDTLWLYSTVGERFATRQLERPKSDFMVQTRELAADLEKYSGVPTFSFLKHYYKKWGKRCPLCENKWSWKDSPRELFAFKCDACRLISSEASDEKKPLRELHP